MADKRDPYDGEYVGNIFGWKLSMIGLIVIVLFSALIVYRHYALDVPFGIEDPLQSEEEKERYAPKGRAERDSVRLEE